MDHFLCQKKTYVSTVYVGTTHYSALTVAETMSMVGRRVRRTIVSVAHQQGASIIFYDKNLSTWEKNMAETAQISSTIIKWGYNKFFSKEHHRILYIKINLGCQQDLKHTSLFLKVSHQIWCNHILKETRQWI
jgi:hypothetical protein